MNKVLFCFVCILCISAIFLSVSTFSYPNSYLANIPISFKTKKQIEEMLKTKEKSAVEIQIKDRVYTYSYYDIGITFDIEKTVDSIFESNKSTFPNNIFLFFLSFSQRKTFFPVIVFTKDYYRFIENTIFSFSKKKDEITIDNMKKTFVYKENEEQYKIDGENLQEQFIFRFAEKGNPVRPNTVKLSSERIKKFTSYNEQLANAFRSPVDIFIQDGKKTSRFRLTTSQLKEIINIQYQEENEAFFISVNEKNLEDSMSKFGSQFINNGDKKIPLVMVKKDIISLVRLRLNGIESNSLTTNVEDAPNSKGELAEKYIEVDISQQRMYVFQNGELINTYKISSGLYYPTPVGKFKILNKAENAWSDIYNVWMPYWMAFDYNPSLQAALGIHEIPYWLKNEGYKVERPKEFIGSPHTGGCIALHTGDAKEVYDFAEINMPVYIYN